MAMPDMQRKMNKFGEQHPIVNPIYSIVYHVQITNLTDPKLLT